MPFYTALSGLNAANADLKVTGNNIANGNTVGYKGSRTEFVDVYASAYGGVSSTQAGGGVRVAAVSQSFSQGNFDFTQNNLDLAISGQGFFVVEDQTGYYYTRAGNFNVDKDGYVINATGQRLQSFPPTGSGGFNIGGLEDIRLETTEGAPRATTEVRTGLNLDASASPPPAAIAFEPDNADSYNYATSITVYDSLGASHTGTMYFRKVDGAPNEWNTWFYIGDQEVVPTGMNAGDPATLTFNSGGTLDSVDPALAGTLGISYQGFPSPTGADDIQLSINYGNATQFGGSFNVTSLSQDGFTTGRLSGFEVADSGEIYARYTNGNTQVLGKVAVANFANPQGLRQVGDSLWMGSFEAGQAVYGEAGTGSLGLIQSGALEGSNVDIAEQLVRLIVAQRSYQANAQVISTADQLTQTLINIRR